MKNCSISQLNGDVNDSNLPLFNIFEFMVGNTDLVNSRPGSYFVTAETADGKIARAYVTEQDKYFTRVGNPSSQFYVPLTECMWPSTTYLAASQNFYCLLGNMEFFIENKYNLKSLTVGARMSFDVKQLNYCDLSEKIEVEYAVGSLDDIIVFPNSKVINFNNPAHSLGIDSDIEGNIGIFSNSTACEKLLIRYNDKLNGNISLLGKLTNLKELQIDGCTAITGSVEDFVNFQIANGRTSLNVENAMNVHGILGNIPFGNQLRNTGNNQWLTWESAQKIIIYGGTSTSDYTKVVAKGASQAEITAWEAAGKTVVHFDDAD